LGVEQLARAVVNGFGNALALGFLGGENGGQYLLLLAQALLGGLLGQLVALRHVADDDEHAAGLGLGLVLQGHEVCIVMPRPVLKRLPKANNALAGQDPLQIVLGNIIKIGCHLRQRAAQHGGGRLAYVAGGLRVPGRDAQGAVQSNDAVHGVFEQAFGEFLLLTQGTNA